MIFTSKLKSETSGVGCQRTIENEKNRILEVDRKIVFFYDFSKVFLVIECHIIIAPTEAVPINLRNNFPLSYHSPRFIGNHLLVFIEVFNLKTLPLNSDGECVVMSQFLR